MGAICVVQARTGSSRLPGKVLQDIAGHPMLGLILGRLAPLDVDEVVVATSTAPGDDAVVDVAAARGVAVVRGDEHDVLSRFLQVLEQHPADDVVRITADCPFTDPALVADVLGLHRDGGTDYTSNIHPRTFPKGLDVEVVSADALRRAGRGATGMEREHVLPHLYRRPATFRLGAHWDVERNGHRWWTVDVADDLDAVRRLASAVDDAVTASWRDLLACDGPVGPAVLTPTTPEAAEAARRVLGAPWAVELAARDGRLVLLSVDEAVAHARVLGGPLDDAIVAALAGHLGVQADELTVTDDDRSVVRRLR